MDALFACFQDRLGYDAVAKRHHFMHAVLGQDASTDQHQIQQEPHTLGETTASYCHQGSRAGCIASIRLGSVIQGWHRPQMLPS